MADASPKFLEVVKAFAEEIEIEETVVSGRLAKLVKTNDKGLTRLADPDIVSDADILEAFKGVEGVLTADLKAAIKAHLRAKKEEKKAEAPLTTATTAGLSFSGQAVTPVTAFQIPEVDDGQSFLQALSVSKTLGVDKVTIRAALEAYYANVRGMSHVPEKMAELIEEFADTLEESVSDRFMEVLEFVTERKYAAVIGIKTRYITSERKRKFLDRLLKLPKEVHNFHLVLSAWNTQLTANRAANPLGGLQGVNPYPQPEEVVGAAESLVAFLKHAFAGFGVMVSKAMGYEGMKIRELTERPDMPALIGKPNRELMLKALGITLNNADVRQEKNIAKYVIYVATEVPTNLPGGQEGSALEALYNLGQLILPWMQTGMMLSSSSDVVSGIGGGNKRREAGSERNTNGGFLDEEQVAPSRRNGGKPLYG